jgi:hypothetical protein
MKISTCVFATALASSLWLGVETAARTSGQAQILIVEQPKLITTAAGFQQLSITVQNVSNFTVVAWGVDAVVQCADGSSAKGRVSTDGYELAARGSSFSSVLQPNAKYTITMHVPHCIQPTPIPSATATACVVVFDNDVAIGDETEIAVLFRARAANEKAWGLFKRMVADVASQLGQGDRVAPLREKWSAVDDPDVRESFAYSQIDRSVLRNLSLQKLAPEKFVEQISQEANKGYAISAAHQERR